MTTDPHPECSHEWRHVGWTTICEPPIAHSVCFKCRTFKHVRDPGGETARAYGDANGKESITFALEWKIGPWDWEREERKMTPWT